MRLDNDDALYILNDKLEFYLKNIKAVCPREHLPVILFLEIKDGVLINVKG